MFSRCIRLAFRLNKVIGDRCHLSVRLVERMRGDRFLKLALGYGLGLLFSFDEVEKSS